MQLLIFLVFLGGPQHIWMCCPWNLKKHLMGRLLWTRAPILLNIIIANNIDPQLHNNKVGVDQAWFMIRVTHGMLINLAKYIYTRIQSELTYTMTDILPFRIFLTLFFCTMWVQPDVFGLFRVRFDRSTPWTCHEALDTWDFIFVLPLLRQLRLGLRDMHTRKILVTKVEFVLGFDCGGFWSRIVSKQHNGQAIDS